MKEDAKNTFKTLILDFQARKLSVPTPRALQLPDLRSLRKAIVFVGMRRSGKTWAMYQHMHELIQQGIDLKKILYINFEVDMGLITAYTMREGFLDAARFETAVFLHLRRSEKDIYYYRTQSSQEIDFLTLDVKQQMQLYQVSVSLMDSKTRAREITALQQAMQELGLKIATIVTQGDAETISIPQGKINCVPLQVFLMLSARQKSCSFSTI